MYSRTIEALYVSLEYDSRSLESTRTAPLAPPPPRSPRSPPPQQGSLRPTPGRERKSPSAAAPGVRKPSRRWARRGSLVERDLSRPRSRLRGDSGRPAAPATPASESRLRSRSKIWAGVRAKTKTHMHWHPRARDPPKAKAPGAVAVVLSALLASGLGRGPCTVVRRTAHSGPIFVLFW